MGIDCTLSDTIYSKANTALIDDALTRSVATNKRLSTLTAIHGCDSSHHAVPVVFFLGPSVRRRVIGLVPVIGPLFLLVTGADRDRRGK